MVRRLSIAMLAAVLSWPAAAMASSAGDSQSDSAPREGAGVVDFMGEAASKDARRVADWVASSSDNRGLPFLIVDKIEARVFLFDDRARLLGAAPALLGLGVGDETVPGIGQRRLATMSPQERTTPAGRFVASLGNDYEQDILWVDYDSGLSLHRVINGHPKERRHQRLRSATPLDNRISYGCINVPVKFYDDLVIPAFTDTVGIVYVLPENTPLEDVFANFTAAFGIVPDFAE